MGPGQFLRQQLVNCDRLNILDRKHHRSRLFFIAAAVFGLHSEEMGSGLV
jgi:hypothetical protein